MVDSNYYMFQEEDTRRPFPRWTTLLAAGAGLSVGILLTVTVTLLLSSTSNYSLSDHDDANQSTTLPSATTGHPTTPTKEPAASPTTLETMTTTETPKPKEKIFKAFTDTKMNWTEAFNDCRSRGMELASVENEQEHQEMLRVIAAVESRKGAEDFWLSGKELEYGSDTFVWKSTGHNVTYHKWGHFNMDLQRRYINCLALDGHCIEVNQVLKDQWHIHCCSYRQFYICEQWI